MYRRILVPLDGSAFAEHAVAYATRIADRTGARLELATVHHSAALLGPLASPEHMPPELVSELAEQKRSYLQRLADTVSEQVDADVTSTFLEGDVVAALDEHVGENDVDLVVMTTHGRGGLSRAWLGSVADALIRTLSVTMLLLRPTEGTRDPVPPVDELFRNVLVPLDGSPVAEAMLPHARAIGALDGARYTLLRVIQHPEVSDSRYLPDPVTAKREYLMQEEGEAAEYLARIGGEIREDGGTVDERVEIGPKPAEHILEHAEETGADLIAIATHGRGLFKRLLLGSVADKVLRGAETNMLVYPVREGDGSS